MWQRESYLWLFLLKKCSTSVKGQRRRGGKKESECAVHSVRLGYVIIRRTECKRVELVVRKLIAWFVNQLLAWVAHLLKTSNVCLCDRFAARLLSFGLLVRQNRQLKTSLYVSFGLWINWLIISWIKTQLSEVSTQLQYYTLVDGLFINKCRLQRSTLVQTVVNHSDSGFLVKWTRLPRVTFVSRLSGSPKKLQVFCVAISLLYFN